MLLYPARRYRRPLLFPPGLLALGFLLLLGCLALRPWHRQLKPRYFIQLTLVPKPVSDSILSLGGLSLLQSSSGKNLFLYSQLAGFRSWRDFTFTGSSGQDAATMQQTQQAFEAMLPDSLHARGIRIRFEDQSTYASMVRMLEWARAATPKYLVDFHHEPTTLYAFTEAYRPPNSSDLKPPNCCFCDEKIIDKIIYYPSPPSFEVQMQNWLTRWQQVWSEAVTSPNWQLPIIFLLGIIAVNCWKIARRWHTA
ncbi:hypothetical protein [Hymenobacter metallicola]|uniref:Uncharacterized protein n=1 Tax=Hymenobacter metallicola TaxID=2563114 RepID=A0A4Z0QI38_9BACT|nr:hypothetical protein [Hymenobacter metallicola]TGE29434.1 hypothetical protein E5K02_08275 [Hymenobacter metallicola]